VIISAFHEDDVFIWGSTAEILLKHVKRVLKKFVEVNLQVNLTKSKLGATKITFCGSLYSAIGISADPERTDGLLGLPRPTTGAELSFFLNAAGYIRGHVINFAQVSQILKMELERMMKDIGSRKTVELKKIKIKWTDELVMALEDLQTSIRKSIAMSFPIPGHHILLHTDASDIGYGIFVSMVSPESYENAKGDLMQMIHVPLALNSGVFNSTELKLGILEKEVIAVLKGLEKFDYLFHSKVELVVDN
jgi:hypothetical protein